MFTVTTVVVKAVAATPAHCEPWCLKTVKCEVLVSLVLSYWAVQLCGVSR